MRANDQINRWVGRCGLCKGELQIALAGEDKVTTVLLMGGRRRGNRLTQLECVECGQGYLVTRSPAKREGYQVRSLSVN